MTRTDLDPLDVAFAAWAQAHPIEWGSPDRELRDAILDLLGMEEGTDYEIERDE